jgi:putative hydrolase of the HAD superfamily
VIRAVLFDVGGPLDLETQFEAAIDADIRSGLEREGVAIDDAAYEEAHRWAVDVFAPSIYRAIIWRLTDGDKAKSLRIYDHMQANAAKRNLFELRDGIIDVLETLKGHGLKLGLAANQPVETLERMERAGIRSYFENPGVSGKYGYRKPDVRLFLQACADLRVQPSECIMVGDRLDCDVVPAKLLGMRTVLLRTGRHRDQQPRSWDEMPDAEVQDAPGILRAVLSLLGPIDA